MTRKLRWILPALALLVVSAEGFRAWWYARGEQPSLDDPAFSWSIPAGAVHRDLTETRGGQSLRYDSGVHVVLEQNVDVIYLEYRAGNERTLSDLFMHSPDVCLPRAGARLVEEFPAHPVQVDGADLVVRHWLFRDPLTRQALHVLKLVWMADAEFLAEALSTRKARETRLETIFRARGLQAALRAQSSGTRGEARMILSMVNGARDAEDAWTQFQDEVLSRCAVR